MLKALCFIKVNNLFLLMKQELSDEHYKKKLKSITNVLQNSKIGLAKISPAGSRAKQEHRPDSDQDAIFSISGNPNRKEFYPKLKKILDSNFPNDNIYLGRDKNIVHLDFKSGAKFELVLLADKEFNKEHQSLKIYRRKNL
jgi:predicted nucleotidyltransferase